jgi:hypothetical protein
MKLTEKEIKIVNYLNGKKSVAWEELAQFSKDPQSVKIKTVKRSILDIKRKYEESTMENPFKDVVFYSLAQSHKESEPKPERKEQKMVMVKVTEAGNITKANEHSVHADFKKCSLGFKRVISKYGTHNLNDPEWDMFCYFYENPGKIISLSEIRDKVMFTKFGSKLPPRWFDSILRVVNNLRKNVPGLKNRLLTIKGEETSYIFQ